MKVWAIGLMGFVLGSTAPICNAKPSRSAAATPTPTGIAPATPLDVMPTTVPSTQPGDAADCLNTGLQHLVKGEKTAATKSFKDGIARLGKLPPIVTDPLAINLLHAAGVVAIRGSDLPTAKKMLDRVAAAPVGNRTTILNDATVEILLKGFTMHAVKTLDGYCEKNPTDELAMNLFGVALDRAASAKINGAALDPHAKAYFSDNEKLEETHPGMKRWGTKWLTANEVDRKFQDRDSATQARDQVAGSLFSAKQNLAGRIGDYNDAASNSNNSAAVMRSEQNAVVTAQHEVDLEQARLDRANSMIPQPTWDCSLDGLMPDLTLVEK